MASLDEDIVKKWKHKFVWYITSKPIIHYDNKNRRIYMLFQDENGHNHNEGFPSYIEFHKDGNTVKLLDYTEHGNQHPIQHDYPVCIKYNKKGILLYKIYNRSEDYPYRISYYTNGSKHKIIYHLNTSIGRKGDKPAIYTYYQNGKLKREEYYYKDCLDRSHKPAKIKYYPNGNVKYEKYYSLGWLFREDDKPSHIEYYKNRRRTNKVIKSIRYSSISHTSQLYKIKDFAYVEYYRNGQVKKQSDKYLRDEQYYICKELYYPDGTIKMEEYNCLHSPFEDDKYKPVRIWYYPDGNIQSEEFYEDEKPIISRNGLYIPYCIKYNKDGTVNRTIYNVEGKFRSIKN